MRLGEVAGSPQASSGAPKRKCAPYMFDRTLSKGAYGVSVRVVLLPGPSMDALIVIV